MIKDLIQRATLEEQVAAWRGLAEQAVEAFQNNETENMAKLAARGWNQADAEALLHLVQVAEAELKAIREKPPLADATEDDQEAFIESAPALSSLQTLMDDANMDAGFVQKAEGQNLAGGADGMSDLTLSAEAQTSPGQRLFYSAFDEPGINYITEGAKAVAYRYAHGRHKFMHWDATLPEDKLAFSLADKASILIVGDWGTGVGRAEDIANLMRKELDSLPADTQKHVVHLGDIYFAGWASEVQKFLDLWPAKQGEANVHSWCLNGNHDMYCGGDAYFDKVLGDSRFAAQQRCSYFSLCNEHWHILGLDTAYEEWSLSNGQAAWAEKQRKAHPDAKGVLLSHHQPYSAYEGNEPKKAGNVANDAAALLKDGLTTAWIWGHEHRCVVYEPLNFTFKDGSHGELPFGACMGHGGVPTKPTRKKEGGVKYLLDQVVTRGLFNEKFGMMGFAVLDIDGATATLRCIDEDGDTKRFTASL